MLEFKNDILGAMKMYRAAYAIDPTYKPADLNLMRAGRGNILIRGICLEEEKPAEDL